MRNYLSFIPHSVLYARYNCLYLTMYTRNFPIAYVYVCVLDSLLVKDVKYINNSTLDYMLYVILPSPIPRIHVSQPQDVAANYVNVMFKHLLIWKSN